MASVLLKFAVVLFSDVVVFIVLFVLGIGLAGWLRVQFNPNQEWMYVVWLAITTLPMMFFVRHRGENSADGWDVIAALPMFIMIGLVGWFFGDQFVVVAFVLLFPLTDQLRRFLPGAKPLVRLRKVPS